MRRAELRPVARTVLVVAAVLAVVGVVAWWVVGHRGDQHAEVRQPGVGARLATPDVVWPQGLPRGRLEDSEWVRAARAWNLAYAVAYNARDVSDADFARMTTEALREEIAEGLLGMIDIGRFAGPYKIGPVPMVFTGVQVDEEGDSAVVTACISYSVWDATKAVEARDEIAEGITAEKDFGDVARYAIRREPDGQLVVTEVQWSGLGPCSVDNATYAYFDPAPPYGTVTQPWEVIGIDGEPLVAPTVPSPTSEGQ